MEDLRYPTGRFTRPEASTAADREQAILAIAETPARLRAAVAGLSPAQLDTPYRPGGWTVRQVVHHVPDSHLNAYTRLKLALTEEEPAIRSYEEQLWAELPEARTGPVEVSLALLDALHERWLLVWRALGEADWSRALRHPDLGRLSVDSLAALYAWHGRHHVAPITALRERLGWH
ncbi:MAG: putative metal-dependent hydrolase [Acidobacteriota bacterium]|nr:putative metal-dependent hydrolase [Acidobacteriota bacterium]